MSSHQRRDAEDATARAGDMFPIQLTADMQRRLKWLRRHHWPNDPNLPPADVAHWVALRLKAIGIVESFAGSQGQAWEFAALQIGERGFSAINIRRFHRVCQRAGGDWRSVIPGKSSGRPRKQR